MEVSQTQGKDRVGSTPLIASQVALFLSSVIPEITMDQQLPLFMAGAPTSTKCAVD